MSSSTHSTITLQAALREAEQRLVVLHDSARIDAEVLLAHSINQPRTYLHSWPERALTMEQMHFYAALIQRRAAGEPVAYLTGTREFWSLPLKVTSSTLIPRPETELLVEHALLRMPSDSSMRIADLGTGCGAVALAIASEFPANHVIATDIDANALNTARINAIDLGIKNVEFRQGSWFKPLKGEYFHLIASNPPYIREHDPYIKQGDLRFEPKGALIAGKEGLEAISIIVSEAKSHLVNEGWLMIEHGHDQHTSVTELFAREGYLRIEGITDIGGHGRIVMGQYVSRKL